MELNDEGVELIKHFEGCRLESYQDSVGVWTIGYGHTAGVRRGGRITQAEADELLRGDLATFAQGVRKLVREDTHDREFSAMVSLAYNIGLGNFGASSVLILHNARKPMKAADSFNRWTRAGGKVLAGLVRRRRAEGRLYLDLDWRQA